MVNYKVGDKASLSIKATLKIQRFFALNLYRLGEMQAHVKLLLLLKL